MKQCFYEFKNGGQKLQFHGDLFTIPSGKHLASEAFRDKEDPSKPHPQSEALCAHALKVYGAIKQNGKVISYVRTFVEYVPDPIEPKDWTAAEAAYAMAAWSGRADAAAEFCARHGLGEPREGFDAGLRSGASVLDTVLVNIAEGKVPENHIELG